MLLKFGLLEPDIAKMVVGSFKALMSSSAVKSILTILSTALLAINGATTALGMIGLLFLIDTLTGLLKSIKTGEFTSSKLRKKTFAKFVTYFFIILSAGAVAAFEPILVWLFRGVQMWIGITEFTSISENLTQITGIKIPTVDDLMNLWNKFRSAEDTKQPDNDKSD